MRASNRVFDFDGHRAERCQPIAVILNEHGIIRDCCEAGERLFGYHGSGLLLKHVSILIPQLSGIPLLQQGVFNPRLDFLCHCGHRFLAQDKEGGSFYCKLHFVYLQHGERTTLRLIVRPSPEERFEAGRLPTLESLVNAG